MKYRLSSVVEEVLYPAMEDFSDIIIAKAMSEASVSTYPFTLVGNNELAANRSTKDRFGVQFTLEYYNESDLKESLLNIEVLGTVLMKKVPLNC